MASKEKFIKTKTLTLFFISSCAMLFFSSLNMKLIYFAPLLIFLFYRLSYISILWISIFLGLFQDVFSSNFFGINALAYFFSSLFSYNQKKIFNDKPINLSIFTMLFSLIYSFLLPILFFMLDKKVGLSIKWLITDMIIFPMIDGIYAFLFFAFPIWLFDKLRKMGLTKMDFKNLWTKYKKIIFQKSR